MAPVFTASRSTEEPGSVPAAYHDSPQHFTVVSRPGVEADPGVPQPRTWLGVRRARPIFARFRADLRLRDVNAGSSRTPFLPARRTVWQYWQRPSFVGAACHPIRHHPGADPSPRQHCDDGYELEFLGHKADIVYLVDARRVWATLRVCPDNGSVPLSVVADNELCQQDSVAE